MEHPVPGHFAADPVMASLCSRHGPVRIRRSAPFLALVEAIVSQQISGFAADAILARLAQRVPLEPESLARAHPLRLRAAGLSHAKVRYVKELARFAMGGGLLDIDALSDEEVLTRLVSVKGIGRWTAEMFLIFSLGRPDVWPVGDGGVQRAARRLYRVRSQAGLEALGERFRPFRSHAAWYLWRALEDG